MIVLLIIAFALLVATAYTFHRRQHASSDYRAELESSFMRPRSLFDDKVTYLEESLLLSTQASKEAEERRASLLKRAAAGDLIALVEARRANDPLLYESVLQSLVGWAEQSESNLRSLATLVAHDEDLRGNSALAEAFQKLWRQQPDRANAAQMLHLAALADEAEIFERAVNALLDYWGTGRLNGIKAEELFALIEGEYWVLSSAARRTGAGFVLKQRLATLRGQLAADQKTESTNVEN